MLVPLRYYTTQIEKLFLLIISRRQTSSCLKRPLLGDLLGMFSLKQICLSGAKKPLPLFYLSGCAAWWGGCVFLQIFCSSGAFDRAKSGFVASILGCLHDLTITLTGFRKPVRLKRPLFCDLFGLFALKWQVKVTRWLVSVSLFFNYLFLFSFFNLVFPFGKVKK